MFIQSDDFIGFSSPIMIKGIEIKHRFFSKYIVATLENPIKINSVQCGSILTSTLVLKPRLFSFFYSIKRLPIEILVLTANFYDKEDKGCKCVLAVGYLYSGAPQI